MHTCTIERSNERVRPALTRAQETRIAVLHARVFDALILVSVVTGHTGGEALFLNHTSYTHPLKRVTPHTVRPLRVYTHEIAE